MTIQHQLAAAGIEVVHHFATGLYAKEMRVPAGAMVGKHMHNFDHFSMLAQGSAVVDVDGACVTVHAPALLTIKAGRLHVITALTEVVWHCIHATDVTDPARIDFALTGIDE